MSWSKRKKKDITQLSLLILIVLLIAYLSSFIFYRFDLTSEKRYSLFPVTKKILHDLNDTVYLKIYLDGDLNIPYKKMQKSIREMLDEFKIYAKKNLEYKFINPFDNPNRKTGNDLINEFYEKGLNPEPIISVDHEGGTTEKVIFPGALVTYKDFELPINLLKTNPGLPDEQVINNSIQNLEYAFINEIRNIVSQKRDTIAFIEGHGELNELQVFDISKELNNYFHVYRGKIDGKPGILDEYKLIIIAKPTKRFSEQDKFVIDQYIMKGGKVLWCIDAVDVCLDSLVNGITFAMINDLNLEDILFRYGVRINPNLIQDIQCNVLHLEVDYPGANPKPVLAPWLYYPLISCLPVHPVTKNLNMIKTEFVNSIDTVGSGESIRKTVLLKSSRYSKLINVPTVINLEEINKELRQEEFGNSYQSVAVLLEGQFESAFKNRILTGYFKNNIPDFKEKNTDNKMLVISDGDIIRNDFKLKANGTLILPLGYDKYTGRTFGNKDFIINAIHYLTDNNGLVNIRSREIKLRLLDRTKIKDNNRLKWQLINTILPLLIIILFGLLYNYSRRIKYS